MAAAVTDQSGKVVKRFTPVVTGRIGYTPAQYQVMMQGFQGVITTGTGSGAFGRSWENQPGSFPLAGKTGTASVDGEEPTSWFVGFGGPNPTTQYVVVCVINQGGYGADAVAPVVRNIFNYLAANPVGPPVIPPPTQAIQSTQPVAAPTTTTSSTTATTTATTAAAAG